MAKLIKSKKLERMDAQVKRELDKGNRAFKEARTAEVIDAAEDARRDGWNNMLTGLGINGRDKRRANSTNWDGPMDEMTAEEIYASNAMARRIAELEPKDCTREWIEYDDPEGTINKELARLKAKAHMYKAHVWARQYGGSGVYLNTGEPLKDLRKPLDMKNIQKLISLQVFNRFELFPNTGSIETNINRENFGMPNLFYLTPHRGNGAAIAEIHFTRLIRFEGPALGVRLSYLNQFWGDSIYTPLMELLSDYGISHAGVAHVLQAFRSITFKMEGLGDKLSTDEGTAQLLKRINNMKLAMSVIGMNLVDKEEEVEIHSDTFAGVKDMLDALKNALQAVTDIPHTILFNESPTGGLSATGNNETRMWYDHIHSQQENYLAPKLDRLFEVMFAAKQGPTNGAVPTDWDYEFKALWQQDEKEKAETYYATAQADQIYANLGVLDGEALGDMRFGDLEIDREQMRKRITEAAEAEQARVEAELQAQIELKTTRPEG